MTILFGGTGVQPTLRGQPTNVWSLQGGNTKLVPAGAWQITTGLYSVLQEYDAISGYWRAIGSGNDGGATNMVNSDGNNWRIANQSGCVVGGVITTAGAGFSSTNPPTVTANVGGAVIKAIVGGAVNTTVTVTNGGSNYTYPPIVLFDAPNQSGGTTYGIQATGHATLSGGAVSTIVVDDQGAGYTTVPNVYLNNDPREGNNGIAAGSGATATATLTGSGEVTGLVVLDFGSAQTSTVVPTLSFTGTSTSAAAAVAIMNWSVASYSVTSTGGAYQGGVLITNISNGFTTGVSSWTNPTTTTNLVRARKAWLGGTITAGSLATTTGAVYDAGVFPGVPSLVAIGFSSGSAALPTANMGPQQDTQLIQPV